MTKKTGAEATEKDIALTAGQIRLFRKTIYEYYKRHGRTFPWRKTTDPYHILVSEIMLQQTQTDRVIEKYEQFLRAFPSFFALAPEPLSKILREWQGLGYNRRALALKKIAQRVIRDFEGMLPADVETLMTFPGIGRATASAVAAFAFNKAPAFIETNIRAVFIHFFFRGCTKVRDAEILPLVEKTLDRGASRQWYSGLMDYGAMLKKTYANPGRKSVHYRTQSSFEGSDRQVRGEIVKILLQEPGLSAVTLERRLGSNLERTMRIIDGLVREGLIRKRGRGFTVA